MKKQYIETKLSKNILKYLEWADKKIFEYIDRLDDEVYSKKFSQYGNSIKDTLIHLAEDHWKWLQDLLKNHYEELPDFQNMKRSELKNHIFLNNRKWGDLLVNSLQNHWIIIRKGKEVKITLDEFIFHISNHATYHRGQIALKLRFLGENLPYFDYVPFKFE